MKKDPFLSQTNVIPFIDILLVVLVAIIISSPYLKSHFLSIKLPYSQFTESQKKQMKKNKFEIIIQKDESLMLNGKSILLENLKEKLKKTDQIILSADEKSYHGIFVKVIDALKKIGISQINVKTTSR